MNSRIFDDPCRIINSNKLATAAGRYMLDVPGNGENPPYMEDPQIIPQLWAGNLWTHSVDIQSSLMGLDRPVNRDCLNKTAEQYPRGPKRVITARPIQYPSSRALTTDQPRATHPAWMMRSLDQSYRPPLMEDYQADSRIFLQFSNNANTRLAEKDGFVRKYDCMLPDPHALEYELPSETMTQHPNAHVDFTALKQKI